MNHVSDSAIVYSMMSRGWGCPKEHRQWLFLSNLPPLSRHEWSGGREREWGVEKTKDMER